MGNKTEYKKKEKHLSRRLAQFKRFKLEKEKQELIASENKPGPSTVADTEITIIDQILSVGSNTTLNSTKTAISAIESLSTACDEPMAGPSCSFQEVECRETSNVGVAITSCENITQFHPEGRRIIAIDCFLQQILSAKNHGACGCNITDMFVFKEKIMGLQSIITLKCKMCNILMDITTDYEDGTELQINKAATLATISAGISYTTANEFMSILNIPFMADGTFNKCQKDIANVLHKTLWKQIEETGKEEAALAKLHGDVDSDGIPTVTVIADGAWSKRSYNVNYNASLGVVNFFIHK